MIQDMVRSDMKSKPGNPLLLGATFLQEGTWNFTIFTTTALSHLVIADYENQKELYSCPVTQEHISGNLISLQLSDLPDRFFYAWRSLDRLLVDPFAHLLYTGKTWGKNRWQEALVNPDLFLALAHTPEEYPWQASSPKIEAPLIYEMHVRGMTQDSTSLVASPGTWSGLQEKIEYLASLGINTIELLPIFEFDETEWRGRNPENQELLYNYWGYSPLHFFSPMQRYSSHEDPIKASAEVKKTIDLCHQKNIQVIVDVVYNHTGEGNEQGPSYSLKALSEEEYYLLDETGAHTNYSGCGNTLNVNHPVTSHLIIESLRHWVREYHVDGFRFDLAGAFMRGFQGEELQTSPLLQAISAEPLLSSKLLILEPWDSGGIYKTGSLFSQSITTPFYEWNDRFRDDVRRFIRGDAHQKGLFATRIAGSEDLYHNPSYKTRSVNYITAHDGFTLADLVSYNEKHNLPNGEGNRDGSTDNCSWNSGVEGETNNRHILSLRNQQIKNFLLALLISKGPLMITQGDEYGHTKKGNNNSWCQDNAINWFQWDKPLNSFLKKCLSFRNKSSAIKEKEFFTEADIDWHGTCPFEPNWDSSDQFIGLVTKTKEGFPEYYIGFLPSPERTIVTLPDYENGSWSLGLWSAKKPKITSFQKIEVSPFSSFLLEWK